jgi:predicted DNA-binding protein
MTKDTNVNVRMSPEMREKLETAAGDSQRTVSNLVRIIIDQWLAERAVKQRDTF